MRKNVPFQNCNVIPEVKLHGALQNFTRVSALLVLSFFGAISSFAQAQLLKDINIQQEVFYDEYSHMHASAGIVYFASRNKELWKTTGATPGTVRLKTFRAIKKLSHLGSSLYFVADDGLSGQELWKSTGTSGGTFLVKDLTPGPTGSEIEWMTAVNQTLFFVFSNSSGKELWKTDGTAAGTVMVKDIMLKGGSDPSYLVNVNGTLFFSASNGLDGFELWKSDGTSAGTVMVRNINNAYRASSFPVGMTNVNGTVYFGATQNASGFELWKSDGTTAGTVLVKDIYPGARGSHLENLTNVNGRLFFSANDGVAGDELWKSNGTSAGTVMVKDLTPGPDGSNDGAGEYLPDSMRHFTNINGTLFFIAYQHARLMIWKSNGTTAGTVAFQPLHKLLWDYPTPLFSKVNSSVLYFNAAVDDSENYKVRLWRLDPNTTVPVIVKEFDVPTDQDLSQLMVTLSNKVIFNAVEEGGGYKLFRSDGTTPGTVIIKDVNNATRSSDPYGLSTINNVTIFTAQEKNYYNGDQEGGIWRTDGTQAGTFLLHKARYVQALASTTTTGYFIAAEGDFGKTDGSLAGTTIILKSFLQNEIENSTIAKNLLFFSTLNGKLWRSDGTAGGTKLLADLYDILDIYGGGTLLYFMVRTAENHIELWRSDGTTKATFSIKKISTDTPPRPKWAKQKFAYLNGVLYFIANDLVHGSEIWRTNGTPAGTYMFADLNASDNNIMGSYDFDIASLYVHENYLYISALDNNGIWKLVRTNGSTPPAKVVDLFPVSNMVSSGDKLYLFATNSHTYPQAIIETLHLWVTDGTNAGTQKLSNERLFQGLDYEVVNDVLYYSSSLYYSSQNEGRLYRSDGSPCGTFSLSTGVIGATPMEAINNKLIFAATGPNVGVEPHVYNTTNALQNPCGATLDYASSENLQTIEPALTTWPNPFTSDFTFKFAGSAEDIAEVAVFSATGFPVERLHQLPANADYTLGKTWPPGLYIVKVNRGGKLTTHMVVKK